jgi:hypothetical protein
VLLSNSPHLLVNFLGVHMPHLFVAGYLSKVTVPVVDSIIDFFLGCWAHLPGLLLKLDANSVEGVVFHQLLALPDLEIERHGKYDLFTG